MPADIYPSFPWFMRPDFERAIEKAALAPDEESLVRKFKADGVVVVDLLADKDDSYFDAVIKSLGHGYMSSPRIQDEWRRNSYVRDLACHEKMLGLLRMLYGREPFPFQTLNFPRGTEQLTHSDIIHFSSCPEHFMCGVWVALQDVTREAGPLHYYPGSHLLPVHTPAGLWAVGGGKFDHRDYANIYEPFIQRMVEDLGLVRRELEIRRGQALIWAANLLHGGSPILDDESTRHSQVTHYFFKDCLYYTPLHSDVFLKRIRYRTPPNVITGGHEISHYLGREVPATVKERLAFFMRYMESKCRLARRRLD